MTVVGQLSIRARWDGRRLCRVDVTNTRPTGAGALVGRPVETALAWVPRLFSLCSRAQEHAARAACHAAQSGVAGIPPCPRGERSLVIEIAQEHLWRLLLDWPVLFGRAPQKDRFADLHRGLSAALRDEAAACRIGGTLLDLVATELFDEYLSALGIRGRPRGGRRCGAASTDTADSAGADILCEGRHSRSGAATELLDEEPAAVWRDRLGGVPSVAFCRQPESDGIVRENSALARHRDSTLVNALRAQGRHVAARLIARVIDLAECACRLRSPDARHPRPLLDSAAGSPGTGFATVRTARGLLLHAVRVKKGIVSEYAIVAPTEWNFRRGGVFEREACSWRVGGEDEARSRLKALVLSLDPCVDHELELTRVGTREVGHA